jgi:SAM-dependent methyltransferase
MTLESDSERFVSAPEALSARLYSALHAGNEGDVAFYLRQCRDAQRVLELGAGAGRVGLALAEAGITVTGVELDPGLLALSHERLARREAALGRKLPARFVLGDMTTYDESAVAYDCVIIPYSALWCLPDDAAKRQCLTRASHCLADGGRLVLDVYDADVWMPEDEAEWDLPEETEVTHGDEDDTFEEVGTIELDGASYRVWERDQFNGSARRMHVEYRLLPEPAPTSSEETSNGQKMSRTGYRLVIEHSVLWRHELAELLEDCGFEAEWGVDEPDEGTAFAEQVVVRAVKS